MSIWQWVYDFAQKVHEEGDHERIQIYRYFVQGMDMLDSQPGETLKLFAAGKEKAEGLHERWWVQMFTHWTLQTQLFFQVDYSTAIDQAVEAVLEVLSRPEYANFPQRICLHEDLIHAYKGHDPHGYASEIDQALDYIEDHVRPEYDCFFCLKSHRVETEIERGKYDMARSMALKYAEAAQSDHYIADAHKLLCRIANLTGDYDRMLKWAVRMETAAREKQADKEIMVALTWQAVARRQRGEEDMARQLFTGAAKLYSRNQAEPDHDYFDAMCAFHALHDEHSPALNIRQHQLKLLKGTARYYPECECRLEIIRLKKALDQPTEKDVEALRQLTEQLKDPQPVLDKLAALI